MFEVKFDDRYFRLLSVENGEVFSDAEFVKSVLTNKGSYRYYAEGRNPDVNNHNTGLILTLTFEVSQACVNGAHDITLFFPDDGYGWYFDGSDFPDFDTIYTVSCTKDAKVVVTGSDATESPETKPNGEIKETTAETKPAPGIAVTEAVINDNGETVKNDDGSVVTQEVKDEDGNIVYYETDEVGEIVTDEAGEAVTFVDTTAPAPGADKKDDKTTGADGSEKAKLTPQKIILIAAICAVVVGSIVIIIVVTKPKKNKDIVEDNSDDNGSEE